MLRIRDEQMAVLRQDSLARFKERLMAHLRQEFPQESAPLDEAALRDFVDHGIQRASAYGITAQRDVCLYVDLMILHGRDVDRDPRHPEAARVLASKTLEPRQKLDRLHADLGAVPAAEEDDAPQGGP